MPRRPDVLTGFRILYGRYASWIIHSKFADDRATVLASVKRFLDTGFLNEPPPSYEAGDLIYFAERHISDPGAEGVESILGLVLSADALGNKLRNLIIL